MTRKIATEQHRKRDDLPSPLRRQIPAVLAALLVALAGCQTAGWMSGEQPAETAWTEDGHVAQLACTPEAGCQSDACVTCEQDSGWCLHCRRRQGWLARHWAAQKAVREYCRDSGCDCSHDFKDGFVEGYLDVADGGEGITPVIPPQRYWGSQYRTPDGHAQAADWFAGFEAGAGVALGHPNAPYRRIATSGFTGFARW